MPLYPEAAMECGAAGSASILLHVNADGRGSDFRVVEWHGSDAFARSALAFAAQPDMRFHVAQGSSPPEGWAVFQVNYALAK